MVKIGFLEIRYYSMAYILGFVLSYFILLHYIKRNMIQNMDKDKLDSYLIYVIIGTIAGARAGYFFTKEINPFSHLIDIFKVWQGGMSFHGGLIGIVSGLIMPENTKIAKVTKSSKKHFVINQKSWLRTILCFVSITLHLFY